MVIKKLLDEQIYTHILTTDKKLIPRYKYSSKEMKCGDCGAEYGMYHMISCDQETCPVCKGQMFNCDCWKSYNFIE